MNFSFRMAVLGFVIVLCGGLFFGTHTAHAQETAVSQGCFVMADTLKMGADNDLVEVAKLQYFLRSHGAPKLDINGVFNEETRSAVKTFQEQYPQEILAPWGYTEGTGIVYILTKKKINEIVCGKKIELSLAEQLEIDQYSTSDFVGGLIGEISSTSTMIAAVEETEPSEHVVVLDAQPSGTVLVRAWNSLAASVYGAVGYENVEYIIIVPFLVIMLLAIGFLARMLLRRR